MSGEAFNEKKSGGAQIMGLPLPYYILIMGIIVYGYTFVTRTPNNFLTGFTFCMIVGGFLTWLGSRNKYINLAGGPSLLCLFLPTLAVYLFAQNGHSEAATAFVKRVDVFYTGAMGYIEYFIAALICGSILSMDRKILIEAGSRYAVPLLGGIAFSFFGAGVIGAMTGYGFKAAISMIALPIMGGGIGAGAIPLAQIYGQAIGTTDTSAILSTLMPAVTLANIFAILIGAILNILGKKKDRFFKGFSGDGQIMRTGEVFEAKEEEKVTGGTFVDMGAGFLMAGALYILGYICRQFIFSQIHPYAWTILLTAMIKILGLVPKQMERAAEAWYSLIAYIGVPTILVCVSVTSIDIPVILGALSNPSYLLITFIVTLFALIGAGAGGLLVKMNFIEAGVTAGLCMANTGGSGDVAVLGAAQRMNLMPFAQISSRIGGAIILLIASLFSSLLL